MATGKWPEFRGLATRSAEARRAFIRSGGYAGCARAQVPRSCPLTAGSTYSHQALSASTRRAFAGTLHRPRFSGHSGMRCATPGSGSTQVSTACAIPLHASHRRGVRYPHHQGAARSSASRSDHDLHPCRADGKIGLARRRQTQG